MIGSIMPIYRQTYVRSCKNLRSTARRCSEQVVSVFFVFHGLPAVDKEEAEKEIGLVIAIERGACSIRSNNSTDGAIWRVLIATSSSTGSLALDHDKGLLARSGVRD